MLKGAIQMKQIEVAAAAIIDEHKVLITRREGGEFHNMWEFPGGKIEHNETHQETVIREIQEELQCLVDVKEHLITINYQYPTFHLTMHVYISKIIKGKPTLTEHSALRWVDQFELDDVGWIPADIDIIPRLKKYLINL